MGTTEYKKIVHIGHNIKRLREHKGIKQEAFAIDLGADWTQSKVSVLESRETIEKDLLDQVAKILNVTPELIENYDESSINNYFSTVFNENSVNNGSVGHFYQCSFNAIDKIIELYERLIKAAKETNGDNHK